MKDMDADVLSFQGHVQNFSTCSGLVTALGKLGVFEGGKKNKQ